MAEGMIVYMETELDLLKAMKLSFRALPCTGTFQDLILHFLAFKGTPKLLKLQAPQNCICCQM